MFVGHFGLAFAGKRIAPSASLGTWFLVVQLADLLWPIFLLFGWEHVRIAPGITALAPLDFYDYPLTHSLAMDCGWALLVGLLAYFLRRRRDPGPRRRARVAVLLAAGVVSHWFLDLVVHRPDLPLWPGSPRYGWGLWNHPAVEIPLELGLFAGGVAFYVRFTQARDRIGRIGLWALLAFLVAVWLLPLAGPPPPNPMALAWVGLSVWLIVLAGWWIDRHREPRRGSARGPAQA